MQKQFREFFTRIVGFKRVMLGCHVHPDGDAIGSMLAMGFALRKMGLEVQMVCSEGVPSVYYFLEGVREITTSPDLNFPPELLICVDCAERDRLALPPEIWELPNLKVWNIDHHITNLGFGELSIVDPQASATGEVIYRLFRDGGIIFDQATATALYTAMATDTGFFRYANTSSFCLEVASILVKAYHVQPAWVAEQVHEQKSYNSVRLLGEVIDTLQLENNNRVAWMKLTQEMVARFPVENEETEGFVSYARSIEGVEIGILFKELRPNEIKLSWRSSSAVDVSKLAAYFGGGGHARAAGCNINGPIDQVIRKVIDFVGKYYEER